MAIKMKKKSKKEKKDIKERVKRMKEIHDIPGRHRSSFPGGVRTKLHRAQLKQLKHGEKLDIKGIKKGWSPERLAEAKGEMKYEDGEWKTVKPKNLKMRRLTKKVSKLRKKKAY